jgi:hypothetical protein
VVLPTEPSDEVSASEVVLHTANIPETTQIIIIFFILILSYIFIFYAWKTGTDIPHPINPPDFHLIAAQTISAEMTNIIGIEN